MTPTYLSIIAITAALALIMASTVVTPAFAIKRFFNCMTDIANEYGKLSIDDVNTCYDKEYHSGPYASHSHSTASAGGSTPTSK
jgi:hypothetical protein